jgi:hypothetical protein
MIAAVIPAIGLSDPRRDMPKVCLMHSAVEIRSAPPTPQSPAARRDMWRNKSSEGWGVMKVVLLCAGYGMRMRTAEGDLIPNPLQVVGLADYADVVTDAPLDTMIDRLKAGGGFHADSAACGVNSLN